MKAERHSAYQDPAVQIAHLEEEGTNKEEGTENKDPNGIKGVTEEFIVHLARAVKDAQQEKKCIATIVVVCSTLSEIVHW